jgi:hypothetical protein
LTGGDIRDLSSDRIRRLMTMTQFRDLCLNEIERRGELDDFCCAPVVPYVYDLKVELQRAGDSDASMMITPGTRPPGRRVRLGRHAASQ